MSVVLQFKNLNTLEEKFSAFSLIKQVVPGLKKNYFVKHMKAMHANNYNMVGVYLEEKLVGVSGYRIDTKLYSGKYIEIDNFVVDAKYRNKKIGDALCDYLTGIGKENKCTMVMLDAYAENINAHRFYYKKGFYIRGFHFLKPI